MFCLTCSVVISMFYILWFWKRCLLGMLDKQQCSFYDMLHAASLRRHMSCELTVYLHHHPPFPQNNPQGCWRTIHQVWTRMQSAVTCGGTWKWTTVPGGPWKELTRHASTVPPSARRQPADCVTAGSNSACWSSSSYTLLPASLHPTMQQDWASPPSRLWRRALPTRSDRAARRWWGCWGGGFPHHGNRCGKIQPQLCERLELFCLWTFCNAF